MYLSVCVCGSCLSGLVVCALLVEVFFFFFSCTACWTQLLSWREEVFCTLQGGADGADGVHRLYKGHQKYLQVKHTCTIIGRHTHQHTSQIICIQYLQVIRFALRPCFPGNRSAWGWWWWWSEKPGYSVRNRTQWKQISGQEADKEAGKSQEEGFVKGFGQLSRFIYVFWMMTFEILLITV